jgi:hypothetical protein
VLDCMEVLCLSLPESWLEASLSSSQLEVGGLGDYPASKIGLDLRYPLCLDMVNWLEEGKPMDVMQLYETPYYRFRHAQNSTSLSASMLVR